MRKVAIAYEEKLVSLISLVFRALVTIDAPEVRQPSYFLGNLPMGAYKQKQRTLCINILAGTPNKFFKTLSGTLARSALETTRTKHYIRFKGT